MIAGDFRPCLEEVEDDDGDGPPEAVVGKRDVEATLLVGERVVGQGGDTNGAVQRRVYAGAFGIFYVLGWSG